MGDEGQDWKLGAAVAAGLIGGAFIGWYASRGWQYNHKYDRGDVGNNTSSAASEEIIREQLNRVECMYGEEGMKRFRGAFVIVVGLGGVGSHAALMLMRSGVGKLRLVDYDQVSVSTLNRHAVANRADVGTPKVEVMRRFFKSVLPNCQVEAMRDVFDEKSATRLLADKPDFVIDAIDNRQTKAFLIKSCFDHQIPVVSCMGAGARFDPTRVQMAMLSETKNDPLCRVMRVLLRKLQVDVEKVPVIYSSELPPVKLMALEEDAAEEPEDYRLLPQFRVRIMPVVGTIPCVVGNVAAAYVLNTMSGVAASKPMLPLKSDMGKISKILFDLNKSEETVFHAPRTERRLSLDDCAYILTEIFSHRCAITGTIDGLAMRRWRLDEPVSLTNAIVVHKDLARKHDKVKSLDSLYAPEQIARVDALLDADMRLTTVAKTMSSNNNNNNNK